MQLGQILQTRTIYDDSQEDKAFSEEIIKALTRYTAGDWGEMCDEDKEANDYAVEHGES